MIHSQEEASIPKRISSGIPAKSSPARRAKLGKNDSFWVVTATRNDWLLLAFGAVCCGLLHLGPVLNSGLSLPLTAAMAFVCFLSPMSAFFFLGCNQFLPFSEGAALNPAQIGSIMWLPAVFLRYGRVSLHGIHHFLWMVPWLGWHALMNSENILHPNSEYFKAWIFALIALQQVNESRGRYLQCLLGLSCGAMMVGFAYWGTTLGLPIQITDWGGYREGFQRMGSVRADAVMVWPALLMGLGGFLGLAGAFGSAVARMQPPRWLLLAVVAAVVLSLPPIVATMTHGAYAGLALMVVCFIAMVSLGFSTRGKTAEFAQKVKTALSFAAGLAAVLYFSDAFLMRSRTSALTQHFDEQSEEMGAVASRTDVWMDAIDTITRYPLTGVRFAGGTERITSHYAASGGYLAHNVFLDYGRYGGVPGLIFVSLFFFIPAWRLWNHPLRWQFMPFFMVFIAALTFWMSLSFQFYKTIWALWPLMMRAGDLSVPSARSFVRNRKIRTQPQRKSQGPEVAANVATASGTTPDETVDRSLR